MVRNSNVYFENIPTINNVIVSGMGEAAGVKRLFRPSLSCNLYMTSDPSRLSTSGGILVYNIGVLVEIPIIFYNKI